MRTWKVLGELIYNKGNKSVTEFWEDYTFQSHFNISCYMGVLRRIITRVKFLPVITDKDRTFGRKNPRFKTYK